MFAKQLKTKRTKKLHVQEETDKSEKVIQKEDEKRISSSINIDTSKNEDDDGFQLFGGSSQGEKQSKDAKNELIKIQNVTSKNNQERKSWQELGVCKWLSHTCKQMGLPFPTPIQQACFDPILKGRDMIGSAPTGSGKTAAFALPILQKLSEDPYGVFCLVLTPTRELAYQISEQFEALGTSIHVKVEVVIGGKDQLVQSLALSKKPHIVIATPGRIVEHIKSRSPDVDLSRIKFLVLDEADRLLKNEGLRNSVDQVLEYLEPTRKRFQRQTLLFSATMGVTESDISSLELNNPFSFAVGATYNTVDTLEQLYMFMPAKIKDCYLVYLLRSEIDDGEENEDEEEAKSKKSVIIFTSRCQTAQLLFEMLKQLEIRSTTLHSYLTQDRRLSSLNAFRSGRINILIATDVASRGLDIPTVELVINFDVPLDPEDYIHRVGRTARAGRGGRAVTLITQNDIEKVHNIESTIEKQLVEYEVKEELVLRHLNETSVARVHAKMKLEHDDFGQVKKKRKMIDEANGDTKRSNVTK